MQSRRARLQIGLKFGIEKRLGACRPEQRFDRSEAAPVQGTRAVLARAAGDAARWRSPCDMRKHIEDIPYPFDPYIDLSRVFARIDAALIAGSVASPPTIARALKDRPKPSRRGRRLPSMSSRCGLKLMASTARRIARNVACRILSASISAGSAQPIPKHSARRRIAALKRARVSALKTFESAMPAMARPGRRITAAATTGPAKGPRPASSTAGDARSHGGGAAALAMQ